MAQQPEKFLLVPDFKKWDYLRKDEVIYGNEVFIDQKIKLSGILASPKIIDPD
jgi:hypothetical protein